MPLLLSCYSPPSSSKFQVESYSVSVYDVTSTTVDTRVILTLQSSSSMKNTTFTLHLLSSSWPPLVPSHPPVATVHPKTIPEVSNCCHQSMHCEHLLRHFTDTTRMGRMEDQIESALQDSCLSNCIVHHLHCRVTITSCSWPEAAYVISSTSNDLTAVQKCFYNCVDAVFFMLSAIITALSIYAYAAFYPPSIS